MHGRMKGMAYIVGSANVIKDCAVLEHAAPWDLEGSLDGTQLRALLMGTSCQI